MTGIQSLLLGVLQGVAEFLPISSSGHLVMLRQLMDLVEIPLLYDVLLHVSTLIVVIIVFRKTIARLLSAIWRALKAAALPEDRENLLVLLYILVATVVTGAIGFALSRFEDIFFHRPRLVSLLFLVTALFLLSTLIRRAPRDYLQIGFVGAVFVGLAQGVAVLPGISRAGITISVALLMGLDRRRAGEFSFLIAIPAILGALLLQLRQAGTLFEVVEPAALVVGFAASFVIGLLSLLLLLRVVRSGRLALFSIYLIPLGVISLILL
ncbi:MAG: undecaprenyl-diphosphate phosphatase [Spirochaetaceae bacterium]|nr:MAG: undecaprenyl-diphosphate phosphatase [Spirochaetaceae bacterium]